MERPVGFKQCYQVELVEPDLVFLFSEKERHLLQGKGYHAIVPLLSQGQHSVDEIVDLLDAQYSAADIYYAIERLTTRGYLEEVEGVFTKEFASFCALLKVSSRLAQERLQSTKIAIDCKDEKASSCLMHCLKKLGARVVSGREDVSLNVVLVEDYLEERLDLIDKNATTPWMLAKPYGSEIWIGPFFQADGKPCWTCLANRLKMNRAEETFIKEAKGTTAHFPFFAFASLETNVEMALRLAASEIFKWIILGKESPLSEKFISMDFTSFGVQEHALKGLAPCMQCAEPVTTQLEPLILQAYPKGISTDGGNRYVSPEHTLKKYQHHVSRLCGSVSSLEKTSQNESSLHIYRAGHNFALYNVKAARSYNRDVRNSSGGKGCSDTQAKTSCLCEALERYSGVYQGTERKIRATYQEIKEKAIAPNALLQFSENQYKNRVELNRKSEETEDPRCWIPEPILENMDMDWSPVWSLARQEYWYVPTSFCYYGHDKRYILADSNGCAAGNCHEEAILQGFFELVERDCIGIWWYNRIRRPEVDLSSFNDPYFKSCVQEYKKLGRTLWVLDLTNDLGIPTFCAVSKKSRGTESIFFGFGTHFDAKIAISRALTEMNQWTPWENHLDKLNEPDASNEMKWLTLATVENQPYFQPLPEVRVAADYVNRATDNLLADIDLCQAICAKAGLEIFVLDQTRPEIELKVVKVIVPRMRHMWTRFAPGRLYDVPVQLGWLKQPTSEQDLNPQAMFM